jgi:hypothetical protein
VDLYTGLTRTQYFTAKQSADFERLLDGLPAEGWAIAMASYGDLVSLFSKTVKGKLSTKLNSVRSQTIAPGNAFALVASAADCATAGTVSMRESSLPGACSVLTDVVFLGLEAPRRKFEPFQLDLNMPALSATMLTISSFVTEAHLAFDAQMAKVARAQRLLPTADAQVAAVTAALEALTKREADAAAAYTTQLAAMQAAAVEKKANIDRESSVLKAQLAVLSAAILSAAEQSRIASHALEDADAVIQDMRAEADSAMTDFRVEHEGNYSTKHRVESLEKEKELYTTSDMARTAAAAGAAAKSAAAHGAAAAKIYEQVVTHSTLSFGYIKGDAQVSTNGSATFDMEAHISFSLNIDLGILGTLRVHLPGFNIGPLHLDIQNIGKVIEEGFKHIWKAIEHAMTSLF